MLFRIKSKKKNLRIKIYIKKISTRRLEGKGKSQKGTTYSLRRVMRRYPKIDTFQEKAIFA